jgi:protein-disulfide isomerase
MRTKILILAVLAALLLGACQSASTTPAGQEIAQPAQATTQGTPQQSQASSPTNTPSPVEPTVMTGNGPIPGCRVTGGQLKADPTLEALFPAVSEKDWTTGPSDAAITITEYSDFQ